MFAQQFLQFLIICAFFWLLWSIGRKIITYLFPGDPSVLAAKIEELEEMKQKIIALKKEEQVTSELAKIEKQLAGTRAKLARAEKKRKGGK